MVEPDLETEMFPFRFIWSDGWADSSGWPTRGGSPEARTGLAFSRDSSN